MSQPSHILLVDDDPVILDLLSQFLVTRGYRVSTASTGQEGLQLTCESHPDLVLLDVNLPDRSGIEVCRQIKGDASLQDVFVILFSGQAVTTGNKIDGLKIGADEYMLKPLDMDELLARIRTLIRLHDTTVALRASQQHYRHLIEILPDAVVLIDLEGRFVSLNPQGAAMLGFDLQEELLARNIFSLIPPEEHERVRGALAATLAAGVIRNFEYYMLTKSGQRIPVELKATVLRDASGQSSTVLGVLRDISARKRSEEQIQLLADAVQSTQELICITDAENRFTFANRAFLEAYGFTEEELLGARPDILYASSNPPGLSDEIFRQTLRGGWKGELLDRKKDGTEFPVLLTTSRIKDSTGRILGLVGVAMDISDRLRAQKQAAIFSQLGYGLSAANTARQAADIILDVAAALFAWEAASVHLYSADRELFTPVLAQGAAANRQVTVPPKTPATEALMRLVIKQGARLSGPSADTGSGLASGMHVPIRSSGAVFGILSIQSTKQCAYSPTDLGLLQMVADRCGDALRRINVAEALKQAEARYHSIFEHATEGIFRSTLEGGIESANPALARIFGYQSPGEMKAAITDIPTQLYPYPEQRAELTRRLQALGEVRNFEVENLRKDGARIWLSINVHVVRDAAGKVLCYEGTIQEITERKHAENLLQTQRDFGLFLNTCDDLQSSVEHLLKLALHNEGVDCGAVHLMDPANRTPELATSKGLSARFAKHAPNAGAGPASEGPLRQAASASEECTASALAHIVHAFEQEGLLMVKPFLIQHGGQVVAVLTLGSHLHAGIAARSCRAIEAIAAQAGGAIARIRAEQSLRASSELLEKTLNSLPSAVFIIDGTTGIIHDCNLAATRIFGYSRQELIGQTTEMLHVDGAMFREFNSRFRSALKAIDCLEAFEFRMKRKNGEAFPTEHTVMPIRNESGRLLNRINVVNDISKRREAETQLRLLPQRIIGAQEEERLRVARELHDGVNQIIASAKMRLRSVQDLSVAFSPAATEILRRCEKLLVQALEENRRIAHNLRPSVLDELGLAAACQSLCREFQSRTNLTVKCSIADLGRRLPLAVELNLFRIVQEALNNLEKHAQAKTVRLRLALQDEAVLLRIQDDGRGFVPDAVANRTAQRRGLGLTNTRERAISLGGTSHIKSSPGQGTVLTVRIPLASCPP
jgi:PAS domain S-box-containing protein